jgi:multisubunit Na+/H+ antiporter MnhC subunit
MAMSEFLARCAANPVAAVGMATALGLVLIGLACVLTQRHVFKIILGFSVVNTATHLFLVVLGHVRNGAAPIWRAGMDDAALVASAVDPIPSALVLTAIVIGLGTTAVMVGIAVRMVKEVGSLDVRDYGALKW